VACLVALVASRRRGRWRGVLASPDIPSSIDRAAFARAGIGALATPWLVAVLTDSACRTCGSALERLAPLAGPDVDVAEVEAGPHGRLHDSYGVDAVPFTLVADRDGRFSYPPQLLLVDGGKDQLGVAVRVLQELGLDDEIPAAALAKQFEEVFVPGRAEPVRIPRQSEALYMLQRVRDESHRFAVEYHRTLRGRRMTRSALDGIAGLGPVRKARLTKELGGVRAVQRADLHELKALPWLPDAVAENVHAALHGKR